MNLTSTQREQLQQRLADTRYQLALHDAELLPVPAHQLADHEAVAFVEYEEWRLALIVDGHPLLAPYTATSTAAENPYRRDSRRFATRGACRRLNRVCVVHQDYWPCRTQKELAA